MINHTRLQFALIALFMFALAVAVSGQIRHKVIPEEELERYEDPPAALWQTSLSPGRVSVFGGFTSRQVNVNAAGQNIVGDAANEPSITVDPTNGNRMAVGWRQFDSVSSNFRQSGYGYTTDAGKTWTFPGVIENNVFRSDPVLYTDDTGQFFYLSLLQSFFDTMYSSIDGGKTWENPNEATGGDKQWFVIDNTDSPGHGFQYQVWSLAGNNWGSRQFSRSTDGGTTWMEPIFIPEMPSWGIPDVDADGNLFVGGFSFSTGQIWCIRSTNAKDGSMTPSFDVSTEVDLGGDISFQEPINPAGLVGQIFLAADRSATATRNNIYMMASVIPTGFFTGSDVTFNRSTDGGKTFGKPIRINDDPINHNKWHWMAAMAVAPNGRIDAVWLDTRNAANNTDSQLFYSYSTDGGVTWSANVAVSEPFNPFLGYPNQDKIGDYLTIISDNTGGDVAYPATFNGEEDIYYVRVAPAGGPTPTPTATPTATPTPSPTGTPTLTPTPPLVEITVDTNPAGLQIMFDGNTFTAPETFVFSRGGTHIIGTTSPQPGQTGTQYVWNGWTDGGAISHQITPMMNTAYTANFTTQYLLTTSAQSGGTASPPTGFFDAGQTVQISATVPPPPPFCFFIRWAGTGDGSYTGPLPTANVVMNGPITESAQIDCQPPPTQTPSATPTFTPTPSPVPEFDLTITQADSPDPVVAGQQLTYTLKAINTPSALGGGSCPVVRFGYPTGVPFTYSGSTGTNNFVGTPVGSGVTFTGGCIHSNGSTVPIVATLTVVLTPAASGTLTSLGSSVIIDPGHLVNETNPNNNTAQTVTTLVTPARTQFDYDGDRKSDISVFRPSEGNWYVQRSTEGFIGAQFGLASDKIVPADYDGDDKTDIAVFRPGTGDWYITNSSNGSVTGLNFGISEDVPVPSDFDADGRADVAVYRPSSGVWYVANSSNGTFTSRQFGEAGDRPAVGDFDGDGKADLTVFRPTNGTWYRINSSDGELVVKQWGLADDIIVPADYDGDHITDIAVYRPSTSAWYAYTSQRFFQSYLFGSAGDIPAPGDFDGDGIADVAVFRPSTGTWYIARTSSFSFIIMQFGQSGDMPTQTAFAH